MEGLRTQEPNEFIKFFNVVQQEAKKQKKVFFLDCAEGNDEIVNDIEVCNLSGWLIPIEEADKFKNIWVNEKEDDDWSDFFVFVSWKNDNGLKVVFE